ncbi:MAG: hypothetical protein WBG11_14470, partial [Methylocella sp.]
ELSRTLSLAADGRQARRHRLSLKVPTNPSAPSVDGADATFPRACPKPLELNNCVPARLWN